MPVTPRRGVARLYQSDLRPPAAGTASFFLCDLDFGFGQRSPACVVIQTQAGLWRCRRWDTPAKQLNRLPMTFGGPVRGILAQSHTLLPYLKSRAVCWR